MPNKNSEHNGSDEKYPHKRLIEIKNALEKRVLAARERALRNQLKREDLEGDLEELQQTRLSLTERLTEARQGEALTREKERQIAAEFHRLSDERRHCEPGPLLRRSLMLGRELFELLVKDVAIEASARMTWFTSAMRLTDVLKERAIERNELQNRVLNVQRNCEADLEQKRHIYDDSGDLKNRNESLDAQIAMLKEWHGSLEMQIASVRAALNQKQRHDVDEKPCDEHEAPIGAPIDETKPIPMEISPSPEWVTIPTTSPMPSPGKVSAESSVIASPSKFEDLSVDVIMDKPTCDQCNGTDCDPIFGHRTTFKTPANAVPCQPVPSISLDCLAIVSTASTLNSTASLTAITPPVILSAENITFTPNVADEIPVEADFKLDPAVPRPPDSTSPSSTPQQPETDPVMDEMARMLNVLPEENSDEEKDDSAERNRSAELLEDKEIGKYIKGTHDAKKIVHDESAEAIQPASASTSTTSSNASFTTIKTTAESVTSTPSSTGTEETAESVGESEIPEEEEEFSDIELDDDETSDPPASAERPFDDIIDKLNTLKVPSPLTDTPSTPILPENGGLIEFWHEVLPHEVVPSPKTSNTSSVFEETDDDDDDETDDDACDHSHSDFHDHEQ